MHLYPPSREQASEEVANTHEAFKLKKKFQNFRTKCPKHPDQVQQGSESKRNKFYNSVSSIFDAEDLWASIDRWDDEYTFVISIKEETFKMVSQLYPQKAQIVFRSLGLQLIWIGGTYYLCSHKRRVC